jgi:hypothetical protein
MGEAPGVQISNMGASLNETLVDSGNRTQAAALTAEQLATEPTARCPQYPFILHKNKFLSNSMKGYSLLPCDICLHIISVS